MTTDHPGGNDQVSVVTLPDEVDLVTIGQVRDRLLSSVNRGGIHLVVDASGTVFMDSTGVNTLVRVRERTVRLGGSLHVVTRSRAVLRVLAITQLDRVLAVVPSLDEALRCASHPETIHTCNGALTDDLG